MKSVILEVSNRIARIRLNRPDKMNAINREMAFLLRRILEEAEKNEEVRCITLTGEGNVFCSGQDLAEIQHLTPAAMKNILPEQLNPIALKLRTIEKPVLCVVNGPAVGAGANLALCCDIVIAAESATFTQAFTRIGLISDSGGTYLLPRLIGLQRATALMMTAEEVAAPAASAIGMIYKSVPDDILYDEAEKIAGKLSRMPTKALVYTRMALNESLNSGFEQQLKNEASWQERAGATDDFKEGVSAFLEKRKPNFTGR